MLNIDTLELKPYYGKGISNYVNSYINTAKKISNNNKFVPDIFTVNYKPINFRDDDKYTNDFIHNYSDDETDNYNSYEETSYESEPNISESSDDEDEFILVE
jgi:GTP-dependent phosphoenolpyruvate carboxykinase